MAEETDFDLAYLRGMTNVKFQIPSRTVFDAFMSPDTSMASTANDNTSASTKIYKLDTSNTHGIHTTNDISATSNIPSTLTTADISATNNISPTNISPTNDMLPMILPDMNHPLEVAEVVPAAPETVATEEKGTGGRYSIQKVQIKPGRTIDPNQGDMAANYLSRLPVLKEQAAAYTPMPYTFRVNAACNRIKIQNMWGRCPPFYLLFDHTIAVIWLLFAEKEYNSPLGISQLQWALAFLKTIHTRQGDHPKDVQTCINVIENILLNQYAELAKDITGVSKLDETVNYIDGALGSQSMVVKSIPFSLNYEQMINKSPTAVVKDSKLSMTSAEAKDELENLKKAAGVKSIESLDTVSKHRAINVLKAWKSEQLGKIRGELRRLRSIEDKMKNIDDNFEGYLEDDLEMLYPK